MYLTLKEASDYLSIPEPQIENLIFQKKIRAIHDGDQYLIYKEQFNISLFLKIKKIRFIKRNASLVRNFI